MLCKDWILAFARMTILGLIIAEIILSQNKNPKYHDLIFYHVVQIL